jgi:hypothetical protein
MMTRETLLIQKFTTPLNIEKMMKRLECVVTSPTGAPSSPLPIISERQLPEQPNEDGALIFNQGGSDEINS